MKKKVIGIILALVLCSTLTIPVFAGGDGHYCLSIDNTDVDKVTWLISPGTDDIVLSYEHEYRPEADKLEVIVSYSRWVLFNESGEPIARSEDSYEGVDNYCYDGVLIVWKDGLAGYMNLDEEWLIEPQYLNDVFGEDTLFSAMTPFYREGFAVVTSVDHSPLIINKNNELVAPDIFSWGTIEEADAWASGDCVVGYRVGEQTGILVKVESVGYGLMAFPGSGAASGGAAATAPDAPSDWAAEQVGAAIAANLVPETLQSAYTQATTRAEFCALAVALYENIRGEITGRTEFSDTDDVNVQKAAFINVVNGVEENIFAPDSELTREQAATMLNRLAQALGSPLSNAALQSDDFFSDYSAISDWAAISVECIQANGIMNGVGNNTFSPKGEYTREQSIITIMRLFDIVG